MRKRWLRLFAAAAACMAAGVQGKGGSAGGPGCGDKSPGSNRRKSNGFLFPERDR